MAKVKTFTKRAGAIFLSMTMLAGCITPEMLVQAAEVNDADYAATPAADRKITTGSGENERNWSIVWSDEFNGSSLDDSKWSYMVGTGSEYSGDGWGNNEQEYYTKGENAEVTDGNLIITAKKNTNSSKYGGKKYTSARLWTMDDSSNPGGAKTVKFAKTYGRIESRIKVQNQKENMAGIWPAFWMMPANDEYGTWACSGELDIMEARGSNSNSVDGTIHYGNTWPNNKAIGGSLNKDTAIEGSEWADFSYADWHTYAIEWLPGELRWYVDDVLYYQTSNWYSTSDSNGTEYTYPAPFDQDFYILLNLAVGGNYDGGALDENLDEAKMLVDYVRAYDMTDAAGKPVEYDESNVKRPEEKPDDKLVSGVANETNYVDSLLSEIRMTTGYPGEKDRSDWFVSELEGGAANTSVSDDEVLTVDVTSGGNQAYSVQLIHNVPLTKGYRYVMEFDAKADAGKTLSAKFGNVGGYPAYSDSYNVDLTTDWQHYKYVFDMTSKTDADGRIEFNFQQNAGECYFKNFSIISTGVTPGEDMDATKEALSDGNHVYNGTFDQGEGRVAFWHFSDAAPSVTKAERKLNVTGAAADASVYQCGMDLLKNDSYKISFDAKAAEAADMKVLVTNQSGDQTYTEQTVSLDTKEATKELNFTMPAVSDDKAVLKFVIGKNTVTLDNVRMIRTSNNNIDWSAVDLWPMYNPDFFNGESGWNVWSEGKGWIGAKQITEKGFEGTINVESGADFWCVGMQSSAVKCKGGFPYQVVLDIYLNTDKKIKVETPDGVQTDYQFNAGNNHLVIPFEPQNDCNGSVALYWGVEPGEVKYQISGIDVVIDESKLTLPEDSARPASVTSAGPVKAGTPFTIQSKDEAWVNAVNGVYVNDVKVENSLVTKSGKNIIVDGSVIPGEGTCSVRFEAAGYAATKAITQKVLPADGNVLVNGKFDAGLSGWTSWFAPKVGSATVSDGEAVNTITGSNGAVWGGQLKQENINVEASPYYLLTFDAYADIERPIQLELIGIGTPSATVVNLTKSKETYSIALKDVPASTSGNWINFMLGDGNGYSFKNTHNVYIDNVTFHKATADEVLATCVPGISLVKSPKIGQDTVFSFTDNAVWAAKDLTVTINGNVIPAAFVTKDTGAKTITIAADAIPEAGSYTFGFTAATYSTVQVRANVLAADDNDILAGTPWENINDGGGTVENADGVITVDFTETVNSEYNNPKFWSMGAKNSPITTVAGKEYTLSFDYELAWDDGKTDSRTVVLEYMVQGVKQQDTLTLSAGSHSIIHKITPGADAANYLTIWAGGGVYGMTPHTLKISNIRMEVADEGGEVTGTPLAAPADVAAVKSGEEINVTWSAVTDADSYVVYRSVNGGAFGAVASVADTSYTDTNLNAGTYAYKVAAVPAAGDADHRTSAPSAATEGVAIAKALAAPTDLQTSVNRKNVTVSWKAVDNAAGYTVLRSVNGGAFTAVAENVTKTTYTDANLDAGTYTYKVKAIGDGSVYLDSAESTEAAATVQQYLDAKAPQITKQPVSTPFHYEFGAKPEALTVAADSLDGGKITYQWFVNETNSTEDGNMIAGATSASYEPSTTIVGTRYYYCVIKNTNTAATGTKVSKVTSELATVTVAEEVIVNAAAPNITVQPADRTYTVGDAAAALTVVANVTDGGTLSYQWYKNAKNSAEGAEAVSGATSASFKPATDVAGTTYYFCKVTNKNNNVNGTKTASVDTKLAAIVVNEKSAAQVNAAAPKISRQPVSKTYSYKDSAVLTVGASSTDGGSLSYQWYRNTQGTTVGGTAITGATKASYTVPTSTLGTTYYYCVITNTNSKATGTKTAKANTVVAKIVVTKAVNPLTKASSKITKVIGSKAFKLNTRAQGKVTYKTSNKKVAVVSKTGKVTLKGFGKAVITVKAAGNSKYNAATKKITIMVTPKKAALSSVKSAKSKTLTVKWKKDTRATGYKIQYATNSRFKKAKTVTIKSNKTTSATLKKLSGNKKYYVRVCEYKKVGKTTVTGSWSKAKSAKVKK